MLHPYLFSLITFRDTEQLIQFEWIKKTVCDNHRSDGMPSFCPKNTRAVQTAPGVNGNMNLRNSKKRTSIKVKDLQKGDLIDGVKFKGGKFQEKLCRVVAVESQGYGPLYGDYTSNHYMFNATTKTVEQWGKRWSDWLWPGNSSDYKYLSDKAFHDKMKEKVGTWGWTWFTGIWGGYQRDGELYQILSNCPLALDEHGNKFTTFDSVFSVSNANHNFDELTWEDYQLLHRGVLRVVRATGDYWLKPSSYEDLHMYHLYGPVVFESMLTCMKDPTNCAYFEFATQVFFDNALTEKMKMKTANKLDKVKVKLDLPNSTWYSTVVSTLVSKPMP